MPEATIRTALHPSEDPAKVRESILNLFPDAEIEDRDGSLEAHTGSLEGLRLLIRKQKIMDASRRSLLRSLDPSGQSARFRLNKQAAYMGRVSFAEDIESPLGDIEVTCVGAGLDSLFKEMAPMTIRGIPVSEERAEAEIAKRRAAKADRQARAGRKAEVGDLAKAVAEEDWDADEEDAS